MSVILNVLSGTKNDIRDKKKTIVYQSDVSFLCPPVINLIKVQVCDNMKYLKGELFVLFLGGK